MLASVALTGACESARHSTNSWPESGQTLSDAIRADFECADFWVDGDRIDLLYATAPLDLPKEIHHTRSSDGGATWSAPVRVDAGQTEPVSTHAWVGPQIAADGDQLVAVWTMVGSGFKGRGPLTSARSADGGRTWTPGPEVSPRADRLGQAFPDLVVDEGGDFHVVWLGKLEGEEDKSLLYASSSDAGASWTETGVVDPVSCECCWNRLVVGEDGSLYTIYRNRDPRDMSAAVLAAGSTEWTELGHVGAFDWQFDGCPHVGAGILPIGSGATRSLHAVVWTGEASRAGTYYVRSTDDGKTWGFPNRIGTATSIHCDISGDEGGPLLRVWDNWDDRGKLIFGSVSLDNGTTWSEEQVLTDPRVACDYPALVRLPGGFRLFWFENGSSEKFLRSRLLSNDELSNVQG